MASLMLTRDNDPQYFLQVENRRTNVFVTQLGEYREEEDVSHIPIVCETPSEAMQHHRKEFQTCQLVTTTAENKRLTAELAAKKQEFREKLEMLAQRRGELVQKEEASRTHALGFDRYLKDCEAREQRALEKSKREGKGNALKRREIAALRKELKKLKRRRRELQEEVAKYKRFEDFIQKILHALSSNYLGYWEDTVVKTLIKRHGALMAANHTITKNLSTQLHNIENTQHEFRVLQEEHDTTKCVLVSKVAELQSKYNELRAKNIGLTQYISYNEGLFMQQNQELSSMLLAISNMAEHSYMRHYGPLKEMTLQSKLDMIQEFIMRKIQIKEETMKFSTPQRSSSGFLKKQPQKLKSGSKLSFYI